MPRIVVLLAAGALVLASAACSRAPAPGSDTGIDTPVPVDAPVASDTPSDVDRDAPTLDAPADARAVADTGVDARSVDTGRDAPTDAGPPSDAPCAPYCDPVTGSYFTCVEGRSVCMCGPCSGDPLACC